MLLHVCFMQVCLSKEKMMSSKRSCKDNCIKRKARTRFTTTSFWNEIRDLKTKRASDGDEQIPPDTSRFTERRHSPCHGKNTQCFLIVIHDYRIRKRKRTVASTFMIAV